MTIKANSIAIPVGFNPRNPASVAAAVALLPDDGLDTYSLAQAAGLKLIGPALIIDQFQVSSGSAVQVVDYSYALTLPAEAFSIATGGTVEYEQGVYAPVVATTITGLAPTVAIGAAVEIPAALFSLAVVAPLVQPSTQVQIPAAAFVIDGLPPAIVSLTDIELLIPTVNITVTAAVPAVLPGKAIDIPIAAILMAAHAPTVEVTAAEPNIGDAYGGGYFAGYISHTADGVATHRLIVAPAATGASGTGYTLTTMLTVKTTASATTGTGSDFDGAANTAAMVTAGIASHPAAEFCVNLSIGGFTDWYLPSRLELEIAYFNLKPGTANNTTGSGVNAYSVPARVANYTTTVPGQTAVSAFRTGNSEAFLPNLHWSSTQASVNTIRGWTGDFSSGSLSFGLNKTSTQRVRAFRREAI